MKNNIKKARLAYEERIGEKVTQDDAARLFGVTPSGYKKWEQEVGKLNGENLQQIAGTYGCSVDYLLCKTDDPSPYPPTVEYAVVSLHEERMDELLRCWERMDDADRDVLLRVARGLVEEDG